MTKSYNAHGEFVFNEKKNDESERRNDGRQSVLCIL